MPLIDMPMEKLKTYQGVTPCPSDLDEFWNRSLEEMYQIDPQLELVPADFQVDFAECFDMFFTGVEGARVHAKLLRPKNVKTPHPAVLQFHGYSGDCGDWGSKLGLVAQGMTVAALDCRGQGGISEDVGGVKGWTLRGHFIRGLDNALNGHPEKLLFRNIFLDTAQMAKIVMEMPDVDEKRVGAMGGSQGGGLTLACASLVPEIKYAAPDFPFLTDYRRVWEMDLDVGAYDELRVFFRKFDPQHKRENEIFETLGYIDIQNLTKRIKAKVFMGTGLMDITCPPSTQFAAYNKIQSEKSVEIYPDFGHEILPGHADRVFQLMKTL
jgi:cephalosporin-C deacetylase